jgi:hypothetical protein
MFGRFKGKCDVMKRESTEYPIQYLQEQTEIWRKQIRDSSVYVEPNKNDPNIPKTIFKYKPVVWEADKGIWHVLLGQMPEEGIWTIGTSPIESMEEFDKELKERLSEDGKHVYDIDEERRQEIHSEVFKKIDMILRS